MVGVILYSRSHDSGVLGIVAKAQTLNSDSSESPWHGSVIHYNTVYLYSSRL